MIDAEGRGNEVNAVIRVESSDIRSDKLPRVYRSMQLDPKDNLPVVGESPKSLGVRIDANKVSDIDLDEQGFVMLNGKGMSVVPNWRDLPIYRIPQRLHYLVPSKAVGALGKNDFFCFRLGSEAFLRSRINKGLELIPDQGEPRNVVHGVIAPSKMMSYKEYKECLEQTRDQWVIDET